MKWENVVRLTFQINCIEGLRIGGSGGGLEIGEVVDANLSAIRDPGTGEFYIPGSSLKGKLRSTLEKQIGKIETEPCNCGLASCLVCKIFGAHKNPSAQCAPTRIVVRDARLSTGSREKMEADQKVGRPIVELKTENVINRRTGTAEHPRTGERVLPGTVFDGEILLHVYNGDKQKEFVDFIRLGLGIIQEASSLGASGSRGYGRVRFDKLVEKEFALDQLRLL